MMLKWDYWIIALIAVSILRINMAEIMSIIFAIGFGAFCISLYHFIKSQWKKGEN
jgi:hypothetical protein